MLSGGGTGDEDGEVIPFGDNEVIVHGSCKIVRAGAFAAHSNIVEVIKSKR